MALEAGDREEETKSTNSAFWWRLGDNAFRRAAWLLIPVLAFTALGVLQARRTLEVYYSTGVLSASSNPLVPDQPVGANTPQWWETPAVAASRTINEQLRTDSFIEDIAERAGLTEAAAILGLEVIRANVWSWADGSSLVKVNASWGDPQTSFALVNATIVTYQEFLAETVASQSSEAVAFYTDQLEENRAASATAQDVLQEFVDSVPGFDDPETLMFSTQLKLARLTDAVDAAESRVAAAEQQIEAAELAVTQSRSEAGRSLTVIDEPKVPTAPESTLVQRFMTTASFALLGIVIVLGALLVGTALDQSVASVSDLRGLEGVSVVATVPSVHLQRSSNVERTSGRPARREKRSARREGRTSTEHQKVDA